MYVCVCKGVTDKQIRAAVDEGARSLREVRRTLGVTAACGKCGAFAREIVSEHLRKDASTVVVPSSVVVVPAALPTV